MDCPRDAAIELLQYNCSFLRSATRALSQAYDEVLRPSGLRITQFPVLARASAAGEMSLSELADLMAMDRTTQGRNLAFRHRRFAEVRPRGHDHWVDTSSLFSSSGYSWQIGLTISIPKNNNRRT